MSLPKYKEIINLRKILFDLRVKKLLHRKIKTHLFVHIKRKISQLKFKKHQI